MQPTLPLPGTPGLGESPSATLEGRAARLVVPATGLPMPAHLARPAWPLRTPLATPPRPPNSCSRGTLARAPEARAPARGLRPGTQAQAARRRARGATGMPRGHSPLLRPPLAGRPPPPRPRARRPPTGGHRPPPGAARPPPPHPTPTPARALARPRGPGGPGAILGRDGHRRPEPSLAGGARARRGRAGGEGRGPPREGGVGGGAEAAAGPGGAGGGPAAHKGRGGALPPTLYMLAAMSGPAAGPRGAGRGRGRRAGRGPGRGRARGRRRAV